MESNIPNQPSTRPNADKVDIEEVRKVKVKTINNQIYNLEVSPTIGIADLKREIEKQVNVPPERQRLIYMAKVLNDEQTLNTFINDDEQTIHLLAKTQQPDAPNPIPQAQPHGQAQTQGQPPQQNDGGQPRNMVFTSAGAPGVPGGLDLGGLINGFLNSAGGGGLANLVNMVPLNAGGIGSLLGGLGNPQNPTASQQPGAQGQNQGTNTQQQNQQPQPQPQSQAQPQSQPQGGNPPNPEILGMHFAISGGPQQIRVVSPGQRINLQSSPGIQPGQPLNPQQLLNIIQPPVLGGAGVAPGPGPGSNAPGRTVIELPHRNVFTIGSIVNSLLGPGATFPGPPMPQLNVPRNSLVLLGGFLSSFQFQLTRLIPFLSRLGDLLQRESLLTNPNERHQVELLSHAVGRALEEVHQATGPVVSLFQNVHLGNNPGEFRLTERNAQAGGQPQGQQPQNPNVNASPNQQHSQQAHGLDAQGPNAGQNVRGAVQNPAERMDITEEAKSSTDRQEARPQAADPNASQAPARPSLQSLLGGGGGGSGNVMGQMLGQMSQMGPGLFGQSLASMLGENREMLSEEEEQFMSIVGPLTIGDLFGLFTAGNISCFDRIHPTMKEGVQKLLQKYGSLEELSRVCGKTFARVFEIRPEHQDKVMEGFEPQTVAEEVSAKHLETIFRTILKDYAPPQKFSDAFTNDFKAYVKEVLTEVSEGFYDGINGLEVILREKLKREIANMASGMEGLFIGMVWPQIWQKILNIYNGNDASARVTNAPATAVESQGEEELLKEIAEVLTDDSRMPEPVRREFSEAYMKGDLKYQDKK